VVIYIPKVLLSCCMVLENMRIYIFSKKLLPKIKRKVLPHPTPQSKSNLAGRH